MKEVLSEFKGLWPHSETDLHEAKVLPVRLELIEGTRLVWQPMQRLSQKEKDAVHKHVNGLMDAGGNSSFQKPVAKPVVLVKKGNG